MSNQLEHELSKLPCGAHLCPIHESMSEHLAVAIPFIKTGLARGEQCLYILGDYPYEKTVAAFDQHGVERTAAEQRGALRILTRDTTYLRTGRFEPQAMLDFLADAEHAAFRQGFSGVRFLGEMTWTRSSAFDWPSLIEYEVGLNEFLTTSRALVSCHYLRGRFDPALLHDILHTHSHVALADRVLPNPYYAPPQRGLYSDQPSSTEAKRQRASWWLGRLEAAATVEQERAQAEADLQEKNVERMRLIQQLQERVKELTVLHTTARLLQSARPFSAALLSELVALLPPGCQYPDLCGARIVWDTFEVMTPNWVDTPWKLAVTFTSQDRPGTIEVSYRVETPPTPGGPFLTEERLLLESLAEMLQAYLEHQHATARLREREETIHLLLDSTAEAIYGVDLQGNCTLANPACARFLGYDSCNAFTGKNMHALIHHSRHDGTPYPVTECPIDQDLQRGAARHVDSEVFWRADGTSFAAEYWSYPIRRNNAIVGAVVTFLDISERKQLTEQLHQSQKMEALGMLAGGVAHDFNNLLTIINGYSELLLQSARSDDPMRGLLEEIHKAGERSVALTSQLLAFSRRQVLDLRVIDLNAVVSNAEKMLRRLIGEDIELVTVLEPQLDRVKADPSQMEQVLLNLAVNARDVMPQGGKLTIETRNIELGSDYARLHSGFRPGAYVMLTLTDTGAGMSEEVKRRLFEPFFTSKGRGKGTGLGLAVVHGIVKQSEGAIEVYSEVGLGTAFKIYLPRVVEDPAPVSSTPSSLNSAPRGSETILLVEDEEVLQALSRHILQECGYNVLTASQGEEAQRVALAYREPIHLLVTDVVMPGMGGRRLAEELLSQRPGIKVLFMSGYTDDAVVRHGILHEQVNFLQKPFSPLALAHKVRAVLTR